MLVSGRYYENVQFYTDFRKLKKTVEVNGVTFIGTISTNGLQTIGLTKRLL